MTPDGDVKPRRLALVPPPYRTDGAAVFCPTCGARFGGMTRCPWHDTLLLPLPDADPTAVAFYTAIGEDEW